MKNRSTSALLIGLCFSAATSAALAADDAATRLNLKPGFNIFSRQQDIDLGKQTAAEVEKQVPLMTDRTVVDYINELGRRLTQFEPLPADFPWSFKVINARDINAFALPGGIVYVNRGAIEAAENEAELAGAIAHETGHVVMRHGTHQLSQIVLAQYPLAMLGALLGQSSSLMSELTQDVIGFGVSSLLLHNSRNAESQADTVGTYVLYKAGYDPHALARFFEIIEKKDPTLSIQFFMDHPIPENRVQAINAEIPQLGSPNQGKTDSPEFEAVKRRVLAMPSGREKNNGGRPPALPGGGVSLSQVMPSANFKLYDHSDYRISHPDNWEIFGDVDSAVTIAPRAGITENAVSYGVMINSFQLESSRGAPSPGDTTRSLLDTLRQGNPDLQVVGSEQEIRVNQKPGKSVEMTGPSPILDADGNPVREHDWLVTVPRADGSLLYMVFIAPERDFQTLRPTFEKMVRSFQAR